MLDRCEILCLGDIILDTYCEGLVERISPEAPIPILKVERDKKRFRWKRECGQKYYCGR